MSQKEPEFEAFSRIDWADRKHDICLQVAGSETREFSVLKHSPESIHQWANQLRKRFNGKPIAVCLEQIKGALIYALLKYEFLVIYPVNRKACPASKSG